MKCGNCEKEFVKGKLRHVGTDALKLAESMRHGNVSVGVDVLGDITTGSNGVVFGDMGKSVEDANGE